MGGGRRWLWLAAPVAALVIGRVARELKGADDPLADCISTQFLCPDD